MVPSKAKTYVTTCQYTFGDTVNKANSGTQVQDEKFQSYMTTNGILTD